MERRRRVPRNKRVDPTRLTTPRFPFSEMERAFEVSDKKLEDTVKVLVSFDE